MYICICKQVTDKQIKTAIDEGARSLRDLRNELGITSQCGQCSHCVKTILKKYSANAVAQTSLAKQNYISTPIKVFPLFSKAIFSND